MIIKSIQVMQLYCLNIWRVCEYMFFDFKIYNNGWKLKNPAFFHIFILKSYFIYKITSFFIKAITTLIGLLIGLKHSHIQDNTL